MAEKVLNTRIQHKHEVEANWNQAINFIPKVGEVIVYDVDANYSVPRIKIGDGVTKVIELPFVYEPVSLEDIYEICGSRFIDGSEVEL